MVLGSAPEVEHGLQDFRPKMIAGFGDGELGLCRGGVGDEGDGFGR